MANDLFKYLDRNKIIIIDYFYKKGIGTRLIMFGISL